MAATTAPFVGFGGDSTDNNPAAASKSNKRPVRPKPDQSSGETFGAAFARARKKGVGTDFTFKGKKFKAVRDDDIPSSIKGNKQERLRKFLNQRKKKGS